ncbi:MAG: helix-turn-helix domain-containing protein [Bacteroidales bacterium]|nr:helix-turn-helix domain-containing protein [Bacteroidales bacterium]
MSLELSDIHIHQIANALFEKLDSRGMILTPQQADEYRELRQLREEEENTWLTGVEAAKILGCSSSTVGRLATTGKLEFTIVSKVPKYSIAGLKRYMKKYNRHSTVGII